MTNEGFFANEGGSITAAWKARGVGDSVQGAILEHHVVQCAEFGKKGVLVYNNDGSVRLQVLIVIQTPFTNWEATSKPLTDANGQVLADDGRRSIYAPQRSNMAGSIKKALDPHGLGDVRTGDKIAVRLAEQQDTGKGNPLNVFEVAYQPASGVFQAPAQQQFQQPQAPQQPQFQQQFQQPQAPQQPQFQQQAPQQQFQAPAAPQQPWQQQAPQQPQFQPQAPAAPQQPQFAPGGVQAPAQQQFQQPQAPAAAPTQDPWANSEPPF